MAMTNSDKLHLEPNPMGFTAYYDPEGLHGAGPTKADALEDLLEQTDEAWRKALDEHDVTKRALSDETRKVEGLRESMRLDATTIEAKDRKIAALEAAVDTRDTMYEVVRQRALQSREYAGECETALKWLRRWKPVLDDQLALDVIDDALDRKPDAALSKNTLGCANEQTTGTHRGVEQSATEGAEAMAAPGQARVEPVGASLPKDREEAAQEKRLEDEDRVGPYEWVKIAGSRFDALDRVLPILYWASCHGCYCQEVIDLSKSAMAAGPHPLDVKPDGAGSWDTPGNRAEHARMRECVPGVGNANSTPDRQEP